MFLYWTIEDPGEIIAGRQHYCVYIEKICRRTHNSEYYTINTLKSEKRRMEGSL